MIIETLSLVGMAVSCYDDPLPRPLLLLRQQQFPAFVLPSFGLVGLAALQFPYATALSDLHFGSFGLLEQGRRRSGGVVVAAAVQTVRRADRALPPLQAKF
jgi:hypothetical protein